jgi:hypothetical protein
LVGCGSAALALGLLLGPGPAQAQGIQATGTPQFGTAQIDESVAGQTTVRVSTNTVVIDWTPDEDAGGNALDFLPTNNSAIFQNDPNSTVLGEFAVLNRILPSTNNNIAVINGNVISRIVDGAGLSTPGGFVAFYSPTGILIGADASFDVGRLLLTTLDTTPASFDQFAQNGFGLQLQGATGSTARIAISPGAQILATPENAFFAVVAADIEMRGTALINGSHAYIAAEVVNLNVSNGLFDIILPVGTAAAGEVVTLDGTVGGPSSTGPGDNHMIYAVARASADPISMLFSGNLGFDPAQSAGVVNGEIILAANYNVFGRFVEGDTVSNGINAQFRGDNPLSTTRADISLADVTASSDLLAIGTHRVAAAAAGANSVFSGNLLLVGREAAALTASGGNTLTVTGDLLVDASDYGANGSFLQSLDLANAQGGDALVEAAAGSTVTVGGDALVTANAFAGADNIQRIAGFARGGSATISGNGGTVGITGAATVTAAGIGSTVSDVFTGAEARGGSAEVRARAGGAVSVGQGLAVLANASAAQGALFSTSTASDAFGGTARISLLDGGGTITVTGSAFVDASAFARSANSAGAGAQADAGEATVSVLEGGLIDIGGDLDLDASANGGDNTGGIGGIARGGRASALVTNGGTIRIGGALDADAFAGGGDGVGGGDAFGGIAGAVVNVGEINIGASAFAGSAAQGGSAIFGFGGNGGLARGGNSAFQAGGTLTQTARLTIAGDATVVADASGGNGGGAFIQTNTPAGRGGDAFGGQFTVPNQADPAFNSGAFLLAGGDNGTLSVGGISTVSATASGGFGGFGDGTLNAGAGGNAVGGLAQVGLALLGQNGSLGQGRATLGDVFVNADAIGGGGGLTFDFVTGDGGAATGGTAVLTLRAGDVTATSVNLSALGFGGFGAVGGIGSGGQAEVLGSLGGTLVTSGLAIRSSGFGGFSSIGTGANGIGGVAEMEIDGTTITINGELLIEADGAGGTSFGTAAGDGIGGEAYIGQVGPGGPGILTVTGHTVLSANGRGGDTGTGIPAGNGQGGHAWIRSSAGATKTFGSLQMTAIGFGGFSSVHEGGDGTGGLVELIATGTGSRITVLRNVPSGFASDSAGGAAMLTADGFGEATFGGNGIGGTGQGGTILVSAGQAGRIDLPVNILADPERAADTLIMRARGIGGDSFVDGGTGGAGLGGSFTMLVDGGTLVSGAASPSVVAQGGSSEPMINGTGGNATGGAYAIRVINNGSLTLETGGTDIGAGARGGNGSGTGNGGNAAAGSVLFEVLDSVANLAGIFRLSNAASGGSGAQGGDAGGGTVTVNADNGAINLVAGTGGVGGLAIGGEMTGGTGDLAGGDATGTTVAVTLAGSTLNLLGPLDIAASAVGGSGGVSGTGGDATGGAAAVTLTDTTLALTSGGQSGPASIAIRADGNGGLGSTIGNGTGGTATLTLAASTLSGEDLLVSAQGISVGATGSDESEANGGIAGIELSGASALTLAQAITVNSSGTTGLNGGADGGTSSFTITPGSAARVDAFDLIVRADASGADGPVLLDNTPGRFSIDIGGGDVNVRNLTATANGNRFDIDAIVPPSRLVADGGNLNAIGSVRLSAFRDLLVRTGQNGIIGSPAVPGVGTSIQLVSLGSIEVQSDATGRGISGQQIDITAGRSILIAGNLATSEFPINLTANTGGGQLFSQPPLSVITMAPGSRIAAGTGPVTIQLLDGAGDPQRVNGAITLANIAAASIDVRNFGTSAGSDINVIASGVLTASGSGRAIDLASLNGEVINLAGDPGLVLTGGGHYAIFAATPTGSQIGSFANYLRRYNVPDAAAYDALNPGGNFAAFRIVPVLTVSAAPATRVYGDANPAFTASFAGFLPGDSAANISGAALFTTLANGTSGIGQYVIDTALGTLLSEQGYQFTFAPGTLTITPRPITVTANDLSKLPGDPDPALTFAITAGDLVNGDQLSGALVRDAGETIGRYAIRQGTLAATANYALTFIGGNLTIDAPRTVVPELNNPTLFKPPLVIGSNPPPVNGGDDDRFGIDFPERPDAPLISEDPLLDDPVASGSDSSLYGGADVPPAGDK